MADELADVGDEAHVEHAVRFVEHEDFDAGQVDVALLVQVKQPARGGDDDIDAVSQRGDLRRLIHAAENHRVFQGNVAAVGAEAVGDLRGEFARRAENQAARAAGLFALGEPIEDRHGERGGFAGAGLGAAEHVFAGKHMRNRLGLDRRGDGITFG